MANEGMKISQLPAATEVLDSDVVAGVGGGVTRKFTFATIASYISTKLTALFAAKQDKITANGVLQGDGDGGVTAKTLDTSALTNDNNHIPTSGVVKSAIDEVTEQIGSRFKWCAHFANSSSTSKTYTYDLNTAPGDVFLLVVYRFNYANTKWGLYLIQRGSNASAGSPTYTTIVDSANASITLTAPRTLSLTLAESYTQGELYSL